MDRDVELRLSTQLASIEATLAGFAKDVSRQLEDIDSQVRLTNGRVTTLEKVNAGRDAVSQASLVPRPLGMSDLRLYASIAIGAGTLVAGAMVWVLKVAGVL